MPDPVVELGSRMVRQGFPRTYVIRMVGELVEHRKDLEQEALESGLSKDAAKTYSEEKLGNVENLAGALLATRRRASLSGRHPLFGFVALPIPTFVFMFLGLVMLGAKALGVIAWSKQKHLLPEPDWTVVSLGFYSALCSASMITSILACYLSRRYFLGFRWALIACTIVFVHVLFYHAGYSPPLGDQYGTFWISYGLRAPTLPELITWVMPLLVCGEYYIYLRKARPITAAAEA